MWQRSSIVAGTAAPPAPWSCRSRRRRRPAGCRPGPPRPAAAGASGSASPCVPPLPSILQLLQNSSGFTGSSQRAGRRPARPGSGRRRQSRSSVQALSSAPCQQGSASMFPCRSSRAIWCSSCSTYCPSRPSCAAVGDAAADAAVLAHPNGQEARGASRALCSMARSTSGSPSTMPSRRSSSIHGLAEGLRGDVPLGPSDQIPGRVIQHPRRHNSGYPKQRLSLLLEGEEIQQHLDAQPVPHIREVEGLAPGLVVHHPQIELAVVEPAVHPVHLAADGEGARPPPEW